MAKTYYSPFFPLPEDSGAKGSTIPIVTPGTVQDIIDKTEQLQQSDSVTGEKLSQLESDIINSNIAINNANLLINSLESSVSADFSKVNDALSSLNGEVDTVQGNIASLQSSTSSLNTAVTTLQGDVAAAQSSISTINGQVSGLASQVGTVEGNLSSLTTQVGTVQGNLSTLAGQVGTISVDVSGLAGRITSAEGQISSTSSTVAAQGATISQNSTAISGIQGSLSTLTTRVGASQTNLLPNGGLENGFAGVTATGGFNFDIDSTWGPIGHTSANGTRVFQFPAIANVRPTATYWISCDPLAYGASTIYCDILFLDGNGAILLDGPQNQQVGQFDFSPDDTRRGMIAVSAVAPNGAVAMIPRIVAEVVGGGVVGFRRVKVEFGSTWSRFSSEASVYQQFQAISTLDTNVAQLTTTVSANSATISQQATAISTLNGDVASLSSTVSTQGGAITNLQSVTTTQGGTIAQHTTDIATANANISTNASAISTANGNIASLTTRVGSAESSITQNATAISNVTGRTASLESTVSTQGASISSLQTATSTLTGDLATVTNRVRAGSNPNLIPGLESGLTGWFGDNFGTNTSGGWGIVAYRQVDSNQLIFLDSPASPIFAGATYTASADSVLQINSGSGSARVEIMFKDGSGNVIGNPQSQSRAASHDFTNDGSSRATLTASGVAPSGSVSAQVRLTAQKDSGALNVIGWRQVKLEQGSLATPYSNEASISQTWTAVSTATGSIASLTTRVGTAESNITQNATAISNTNGNLASLTSTVSTQGGAISSLQSVTTTQGGTIAQHTSDISTANANISSNSTAISTLSGSVATLANRVSATGSNLLPNGGLANGFASGVSSSGTYGFDVSQFWGPIAITSVAGVQAFDFAPVPANPGSTYTLSCDPIAYRDGCIAYVDLQFRNAAGQVIYDGPQNEQNGPFDFSENNARRALIAVSAQAPSGAVDMVARFVGEVANGGPVGFRRMKLEHGPNWTSFSDEASVVQTFSALSSLGTSYASLSTRVSSAEGSVTSLQSSMTSANGSISTLQSNVSSLNGSVSTLQQSSTTQAGQISSLQSTVSTQGSQISTNAQAITTLTGSVATLSNTVRASSNPNLIAGLENGLSGWVGAGFATVISGGWGVVASRSGDASGLLFLDSPDALVFGEQFYTAAADSSLYMASGVGSCRVEILFKNSAFQIVGNPQSQSRVSNPSTDFDNTGDSRGILTATGQAPPSAVYASVRLTVDKGGGTISTAAWRQVKLEQGQIATPYSGEASAAQVFTAYADLNSSFASLSTTVSSQGGSISTLQSSYTSLNGTVSSLSSTVSAQGTSISTLQSASSTHAGQIATLNTQIVSGGGNLLQNTDFAIGTTGWSFNQQGTAHSGGRDLLGDNYRPLNEHNIAIYHSNNNGADYAYWAADRVAIVPGKIYEFSAGIANNRANCALYLRYVYGDGSIAQDFTVAKNYFSEGRLLENFPTFFVRGQAPAGAWWVECLLLKSGTSPGYADSYAWFVRPQLVEVPTVSGGPAAYSPGATGAVVSQQAQAISSATGQLSTLSSTVSAQGAQVSNLQSAYSGLNGTVASLQSTVSANSASISTLQSATSTLQGNVATLTTRVSAAGGNLLPNGGLENGFNTGVSDTGGFNFFSDGWGPIAQTAVNGLHVFYFSPVENPQIGAQYTVAMDPLNFGASDIYCNIVCVDSAGNVLLDGTPGTQISGGDFSNNDDRRARSACTVTVPSNTARLIVRAYGTVIDGQPIGFRRVKLERSNTWSPYSDEASITQSFSTLSTLNTQYASLSSTVSTQGVSISQNITAISTAQNGVNTLMGKAGITLDVNGYITGWALNNNGSSGNMVINADSLAIIKPGGGARTEYSNGAWKIFDANGVKRVQIGNLSA